MARPKAFVEDDVLQKAVNLFWCRGYEATSMQDLVDELGINRASLYDTFGDKYQLYRRALDRYRQTNQMGLCALFNQDRPATNLLRELLDNAIYELVNDTERKGCFMVNSAIELAAHDPEMAHLVAENQKFFEGRLTELVARGQREGDITTAHTAADLARFLFATYNGMNVLAKFQSETAALQSVVGVVMSHLQV